MSQVLLYHYQEGKAEPAVHEISNASAWVSGLCKLIDWSGNLLTSDYNSVYKPAYNEFQGSSVPKWQKIAAGFLADHTLVLDEDRPEIADALTRAFEEIDDGQIGHAVRNVGDKVLQLDRGPIVVTTSFTDKEGFPYETRVNIADFRTALGQYQGNPTADEIECLLEDYKIKAAVSVDTVLTMFRRAVPVPRYWE
jgi:hypothetical protein